MESGIDEKTIQMLSEKFSTWTTKESFESEVLESAIFSYYTLRKLTAKFKENYEKQASKKSFFGKNKQEESKLAVQLLDRYEQLIEKHGFFATLHCGPQMTEAWGNLIKDPDRELLGSALSLSEYSAATGKSIDDILEPYPYEEYDQMREYIRQNGTIKGYSSPSKNSVDQQEFSQETQSLISEIEDAQKALNQDSSLETSINKQI